MELKNEAKFIKAVEGLIEPMGVSDLLFMQKLKGLLPAKLMKKMLYYAAKKNPYIGFVIEPYSFFLFFKLKDIERAKAMLPERYELARTKLFEEDEPEYYLGMGNLGTRASTFWGARHEMYLIARDKESGLLSFIFIDIFSNTLIALPTKGVVNPNCEHAFFTSSSRGDVYVDFKQKKTGRAFSLKANIKRGVSRKLYPQLWVMGNTSIAHSKDTAGGDYNPFAVVFDPHEVEEALDIPLEDVQIEKDTLFPGMAEETPARVICFPYAQHYIADSPGCYTTIKDQDELIGNYNALSGKEKHKTFSSKTIVRQLVIGIGLSVALALLLFWKL